MGKAKNKTGIVKTFTADTNVRNVTANQKSKTVYKNVLGSPFIPTWPTVHTDLGQTILTQLLATLAPVGEYRIKCRALKKQKKSMTTAEQTITPPDIHSRLHVGINQVTRFMESLIEKKRLQKEDLSTTTPVIFICKREIKPLQLCQHLLYMAALAKIKLIPMPADSECRIGKALGITRACVVLIEIMENKEESLRLSTREIPFVDAPWLNNALDQKVNFIHDNVKILKTVAPMKEPKKPQQQQTLKRKADDDPVEDTNKKLKN